MNTVRCPKCGSGKSRVKDSRRREAFETVTVHRKRRCEDCKVHYSTFELTEKDLLEFLEPEEEETTHD